MKRRVRAIAVPAPVVKRLWLLAVLLAFTAQAYLIQTHIHFQPAGPETTVAAASQPSPDPLAPGNCVLCQEIIHAGAAITPVPASPPAALVWTAATAMAAALPALWQMPQTGWRSRAPPRR